MFISACLVDIGATVFFHRARKSWKVGNAGWWKHTDIGLSRIGNQKNGSIYSLFFVCMQLARIRFMCSSQDWVKEQKKMRDSVCGQLVEKQRHYPNADKLQSSISDPHSRKGDNSSSVVARNAEHTIVKEQCLVRGFYVASIGPITFIMQSVTFLSRLS